jgi:C4-type Zn-finger protein
VQTQQCRDVLSWIERAINGEVEFTMVVCDFDGLSKIVGEDVIEGELDETCKSLISYSI